MFVPKADRSSRYEVTGDSVELTPLVVPSSSQDKVDRRKRSVYGRLFSSIRV